MTQKDKLMRAFLAIQSIKSTAKNIETECSEYSKTASMYAENIINVCNNMLKIL